jgi:hypothetical protein
VKKSRLKTIFLSHGLAETGLAQALAEALSQQGLLVSEPSTRMLQGDNFASSIASALKSADGMVVILTPASVKSPLLQNEIAYALKRPRFKNKVVPVITGKIQTYPWILRQMKPIQFGGDFSVTASDVAKRLRATKHRTKPLLKTAA